MSTQTILSTDPIYGALGTGSSYPLSSIAKFSGITTLAALAGVTTLGGATPYTWVTNSAYGLTFTKTTSAQTTSGTTLTFSNLSGDLANPAQYLVVGMLVIGTNIPSGATIAAISFNGVTPNASDGPLGGTITLSSAVTGTVSSGQTITFTYSPSLIQALQMDWLAIQAAEVAAGAAPLGAQHKTPAGNYQINRTIIRSDTPVGDFQTNQSSWFGDGMIATRLTWITDSGYGTWAISPSNRTVGGNIAYSEQRDMSVWGPASSPPMGNPGCYMHGIAVSRDFFGLRLSVRQFYSGLNLVNDHQNLIECFFQGNFFNVYFAPYASQNTGDQSFIDCYCDGSTGASFACAGTNQIVTALFERCHSGFGPYAFYKEAGSQLNFLINSLFARVSMEACGNGGIYDSNSTGLISGCEFISTDIALDTTNTYEISTNPTHAAIYAGYLENCFFHGEADPYTAGYNRATHPYNLAIIAGQSGISNSKFWNAANLLVAGTNAVPSLYSGSALVGQDVLWDSGVARGTFRTVSGAITAGNFVSMTNYGLAIAVNSTNPGIIGLAMQSATGGTAGACIAICDAGVATVNKTNPTDVLTAGNYVQIHSSSDGSIVAFNPSSRTTTVGLIWNAAAGGGGGTGPSASGTFVNVDFTNLTGQTVQPYVWGVATGTLGDSNFNNCTDSTLQGILSTLAFPLYRFNSQSGYTENAFPSGATTSSNLSTVFGPLINNAPLFIPSNARIIIGLGATLTNWSTASNFGTMCAAVATYFKNTNSTATGAPLPIYGFEIGNEADGGSGNAPSYYYSYFNAASAAIKGVSSSYKVLGPVFSYVSDVSGFTSNCSGNYDALDYHAYLYAGQSQFTSNGGVGSVLTDNNYAFGTEVANGISGTTPIFIGEYNQNDTYGTLSGGASPGVCNTYQQNAVGAVFNAQAILSGLNSTNNFQMAGIWEVYLDSDYGIVGGTDCVNSGGNYAIAPGGYLLSKAASTIYGERATVTIGSANPPLNTIACTDGTSRIALMLINYSQTTAYSGQVALAHWPLNSSGTATINQWVIDAANTTGQVSTLSVTSGLTSTVTVPAASVVILYSTSSSSTTALVEVSIKGP
jgi:hypothetical protein